MTTKVIRNRQSKNTFGISALRAGLLLTGSLASFAQDIEPETNRAGALYILTNSRAQNAVAVFQRGGDGTLSAAGIAPTGGSGTGDLLDSQGSLILSPDKRMENPQRPVATVMKLIQRST